VKGIDNNLTTKCSINEVCIQVYLELCLVKVINRIGLLEI